MPHYSEVIVGVLQKGFKDQSLQLTELQHLPQEEGEEEGVDEDEEGFLPPVVMVHMPQEKATSLAGTAWLLESKEPGTYLRLP